MARVRLAPGALDDLVRTFEHLRHHEAEAAEARVAGITSALDVLEDNPMIGRPAGGDRRELLTGRAARGYVALYHYLPVLDIALVVAIRGQREAGYSRDP